MGRLRGVGAMGRLRGVDTIGRFLWFFC